MPRPVIALVTDFGTSDHYVGTMKGVMAGICPDALFIDVTHDLPGQDVLGGALTLESAYPYFPPGTVFLVVVDPGVGTSRRPIAAAAGGVFFVAPDNGVLTPVLAAHATARVVALTSARHARATISRTFEGRDRFAPAAAWLAAGAPLEDLGPAVQDAVRLELPAPHVRDEAIEAHVVAIDRFGNAITDLDERALDGWRRGSTVRIRTGRTTLDGLVPTYGSVAVGAPCALVGSSGRIEVAVNGGSAAERLLIGRGDTIRVERLGPPGGPQSL
jgi:S-adenosylmethionine hydrolase